MIYLFYLLNFFFISSLFNSFRFYSLSYVLYRHFYNLRNSNIIDSLSRIQSIINSLLLLIVRIELILKVKDNNKKKDKSKYK